MSHAIEDKALSLAKSVWLNCYGVKNALEQYSVIAEKARALNKKHALFWGITQKHAMDSAVLGLCRLYDEGSRQYKKFTTHEMLKFIEEHLSIEQCQSIIYDDLRGLGVRETTAKKIINGFRNKDSFQATKTKLCLSLAKAMPKKAERSTLQRLYKFRNKVLAHSEQIEDAATGEQLKFLPSLARIEKLRVWAEKFCLFFTEIFCSSVSLSYSARSARMSTLNVAGIMLGVRKINMHEHTEVQRVRFSRFIRKRKRRSR